MPVLADEVRAVGEVDAGGGGGAGEGDGVEGLGGGERSTCGHGDHNSMPFGKLDEKCSRVSAMVYKSKYPIFSVTVDVVCLTVRADRFQVLLVRRGGEPFKDRLALPGGFVKIDEDLETAARRELAEETAVAAPRFIEQLATYGAPDRDPRGRTVSVAYLAVAPDLGDATGGSDAAEADWHDVDELLADPSALAFDHAQILADARRAGPRQARVLPPGRGVLPAGVHHRRAAPHLRAGLGHRAWIRPTSTAR